MVQLVSLLLVASIGLLVANAVWSWLLFEHSQRLCHQTYFLRDMEDRLDRLESMTTQLSRAHAASRIPRPAGQAAPESDRHDGSHQIVS